MRISNALTGTSALAAVKRLSLRLSGYLVATVFAVQPVAAQTHAIVTGEDLQKICADDARFSECTSYLDIVYKVAKVIGRLGEPQVAGLPGSCGPDLGIDTVPLPIARRLAWQEYARKNPQQLQGLAVETVLLAFEARWPCQ